MNMSLGFWKLAADRPDWIALVAHDGTEHRAGDVLARTHRLVHGLRDRGIGRGDAVAAVMHNSVDFLALFLAVGQCGAFLVPVNWHLTAPEIAYILTDSSTKAVFCSPEFADAALTAADEAGIPGSMRFCTVAGPGLQSISAIEEGQPDSLPDDRTAGSAMHYTSGTTGRPKGVRRPLPPVAPELVATGYAQFLCLFGMRPFEGVHLVFSPMYHTAVLNFATSSLHLGHTVVVMRKWDAEGALRRIEAHSVTQTHMVPTQLIRLLALPEEARSRYDVGSLRHVIHSAAPCPAHVKRAMLEWWGPCIYEYYAATEGGGTLVGPEEWLERPGTVGKAWPGSTVRVLDDEGDDLPPGEVGTVWMRMGEHTFEYHGDKSKTDKAWNQGFFTVGDAGYLDADGYLFLCDRKADMIISGGVNIYPAEIEAVLIEHPAVADVAVFGVPDEEWGEAVMAVVEAAAGRPVGPGLGTDILAWASDRLAKYKRPRRVDFTDAMPRDDNGKLYKRKLRDPYWADTGRAI